MPCVLHIGDKSLIVMIVNHFFFHFCDMPCILHIIDKNLIVMIIDKC